MIGFLLAFAINPSVCDIKASMHPPLHNLVLVTLPRSLEPDGCPMWLQHGTRVYSVPTIGISYMDHMDGKAIWVATSVSGFGLTERRTASALIFTDAYGNVSRFPLSAVVDKNVRDYSMMAYPPGVALPVEFRNRPPDYVVP